MESELELLQPMMASSEGGREWWWCDVGTTGSSSEKSEVDVSSSMSIGVLSLQCETDTVCNVPSEGGEVSLLLLLLLLLLLGENCMVMMG
jgi:hypothetical protein